jgi:hypothetical protein
MGQLLVPALIGAGVGAVGGAAMGKNPFTTALLGAGVGLTGGAGGLFGGGAAAGGATAAGTAGVGAGEGLIGGSLLSTAGGVGVPTAAGATGGLGSMLSGFQGVETAPVSFGTGGYASGIGGQVIGGAAPVAGAVGNGEIGSSLLTNSKSTPLNMMDKVGNYISNMPSNAMNYIENNPISSAKMALDVATPPPQQQTQAPIPPILRGSYDPSASLMNVSPNIDPMASNKKGLLGMMASIPMTDEERMRLQQLGYRG